MDALIDRIVGATGLDAAVAREAAGHILQFLSTEAPGPAVDRLLAAIPGSAELLAEAGAAGGSGGGLMGFLGGGGGVMALGSRVMGAGVPMNKIEPLAHELFAYGKEVTDDETMSAILDAVPGLSQFL